MISDKKAQIGVFGGSGFYDFLKNGKEIKIKTLYGMPSDKIFIGNYKGKKIAFLPRHGKGHIYPPHKIPYRANLYAFKMLGVKQIIAPVAVGSLQPKIKPGDFVICDQFVDRTHGREDTFFERSKVVRRGSPRVVHISTAEPYCPELRKLAIKSCEKLNSLSASKTRGIRGELDGNESAPPILLNRLSSLRQAAEDLRRPLKIRVHDKGTIVVINGPRFSTKAESRFYSKQGWDVINMTQYPECVLAKELEMCYLNISLITDYDAGLEGRKDIKAVNFEEIARVFKSNNERVQKLIFEIIAQMPEDLTCSCHESLKDAIVS